MNQIMSLICSQPLNDSSFPLEFKSEACKVLPQSLIWSHSSPNFIFSPLFTLLCAQLLPNCSLEYINFVLAFVFLTLCLFFSQTYLNVSNLLATNEQLSAYPLYNRSLHSLLTPSHLLLLFFFFMLASWRQKNFNSP